MKKLKTIKALIMGATIILGVASCTTEVEKVIPIIRETSCSNYMTVEPMKIVLTASVPQENGYLGTESNTKVTVTATITTDCNVSRVVWKKDGSVNAKELLADSGATSATEDAADNKKWTFDIEAWGEQANGTYTVAAIDVAGREETEQIRIDQFDFTAPKRIKVSSVLYENSLISFNWNEPTDSDFDHVEICYISNNGTGDSEVSAVDVPKGTTECIFSDIDSNKAYYRYSFTSVDKLGNKSSTFTYMLHLNTSKITEDFVYVTGGTVIGEGNISYIFGLGNTVSIRNMLACDHEVTQKEYEIYCKYSSSCPSTSYGFGENYPAYFVSWYDAIVYCNLRSIAEKLTPVYAISGETDPTKWEGVLGDEETKYCGPSANNTSWEAMTFDTSANGYRLPTEAEWEYIARGGNNGIFLGNTYYSGSDNCEDVAWYNSNSNGNTHEVKGKEANTLGIYDMTGNVWEYCYEWTEDFNHNRGRAIRGGCWNSDIDKDFWLCELNIYTPNVTVSYARSRALGFRVVRNAD